jgi:hypothetical protein
MKVAESIKETVELPTKNLGTSLTPFCVFDGSSGMGKTQLALTLKNTLFFFFRARNIRRQSFQRVNQVFYDMSKILGEYLKENMTRFEKEELLGDKSMVEVISMEYFYSDCKMKFKAWVYSMPVTFAG